MKRHSRYNVLKTMGETGFVPLFYNVAPNLVQYVQKAFYS